GILHQGTDLLHMISIAFVQIATVLPEAAKDKNYFLFYLNAPVSSKPAFGNGTRERINCRKKP
ncbi:MAG TPA: hypothetical protein VM871_08140, partial [Flavisolibacter sp.]|nr:hypothetical protein [Flavisolibacter sp.]